MDTIFKYPIGGEPGVKQQIETLDGPIVHVGLDPTGLACFWVRGDTEQSMTLHNLLLVGTGWPLGNYPITGFSRHLGSFVQGPFVWHLWEV